jgi:N-acetylglucosamine-6-phosphate deacetylase
VTSFACINGVVLLPTGTRAEGLAVTVADGRIASIGPAHDVAADIDIIDLEGHVLAPGFVDVQVNGGGGALFNDAPTVETIRTIAAAHYPFGTTALLPTLISDDLGKIQQAYAAVNAAIDAGVQGVVGIHIEGPFLNSQRRGIHDDRKIRRLDDLGIAEILTNRPAVTLMTLAPECVSLEQIRLLNAAGLLLCAGHSEGSYQQINASLEAGVIGVTHLFNAMSQLTAREPGAVGAALASARCWCCIIVDGVHVHPETLRLAIKAKGNLDRFVLVTDAMPAVGQAEKDFILNGEHISVRDGVCQNSSGTLAGSDLDMAAAVANASLFLGLDQVDAVRLATLNPARMLGMENRFGSLKPGLDANMVEIADDGTVLRTWIDGRLVWTA